MSHNALLNNGRAIAANDAIESPSPCYKSIFPYIKCVLLKNGSNQKDHSWLAEALSCKWCEKMVPNKLVVALQRWEKKAWLFAKLQPGRARKRINAT